VTTEDFIIELFFRIDEELGQVPKHAQATLYPSEVLTLALLFALKGVGNRAFYRWLQRDWQPLFPRQPLIRQFEEEMIVLADLAFHAQAGDPANLKLCRRGQWNDRMMIETTLSMLTLVSHCKKVMPRVWAYLEAV
jgi:hypothetical protein